MESVKKIRISTTLDKVRAVSLSVIAVALFIFCAKTLDLDIEKFILRLGNAGAVISHFNVITVSKIPEALEAMFASICLATASLAIGFSISIVLVFLGASNTSPSRILSSVIKSLMAVVRAIPALVWILMVVASMGFGNIGGMVGLIFPTMGYLTKSFISSIEELGYNTIEAMQASGANRFSIITKGLMPALIASFISWVAMRLEGNIAESINLGMVGVAGIGSLLMRAIGKYDYGAITAIILVIFVTLATTELAINKLKRAISK